METQPGIVTQITWRKPKFEKNPPFGKVLLGLKFPDEIILVKLHRIDESGEVFIRADFDPRDLLMNIFTGDVGEVKIDLVGEIELPKTETETQS